MISFDIKCAEGNHVFEIWFRSSADYESQREARQILCPFCGDHQVEKAVMAPAVAAKSNRRTEARQSVEMVATADELETIQKIKLLVQKLAEAQAESLKESQWVGAEFTERARAMHYGEADQVLIHGTANAQDAREMMEEGLSVMPLLVPVAPPDQTN